MLYGENPFFGLNIAEIISHIRKYSGSNLPFHDDKNPVSDLSKDLIRRLLEMDPDKRIDWEGFFKHPVFERQVYSGPNAVIEREFQQNKNNAVKEPKALSFKDPLAFGINKAPQMVPDSTPTANQNHEMELELACKENMFRYIHEKNKILLMFLTVKKLRQLMKDPDYYELSKYIYLLMMILAKKGSMLSELTLYSLTMKNNIFKLNVFDRFCNNTQEYLQICSLLKEDQDTIFNYHNYAMSVKNEVNLLQDDEAILAWLNTTYIDLGQLDEKAHLLYLQIRDLPKPVKLTFNAEENRRFQLTMFLVLHSIKSEILLPYIDNGRKLEWQTLKVKLESMAPEVLRQSILSIEVC